MDPVLQLQNLEHWPLLGTKIFEYIENLDWQYLQQGMN